MHTLKLTKPAIHTRSGWPPELRARTSDLSTDERADLARALKTVLLKFDGLWQCPFPYIMAWYQAPTGGRATGLLASASAMRVFREIGSPLPRVDQTMVCRDTPRAR
jgi:galactose-1-phosphate uridylyltransferase